MRVLFWAICLSTVATYTSEAMCTSVDQGTSTAQVKERPITRHLLTVYQTRSSLNICRQMAFFEIVQTLILRFANMEKWINLLNLSTLIFRTLQYLIQHPFHLNVHRQFYINLRHHAFPRLLAATSRYKAPSGGEFVQQ